MMESDSQGPVPHISLRDREKISKKLGVAQNDPELSGLIEQLNRLADMANAHIALNAMGANAKVLAAAKKDFEGAAEHTLEVLVPFVMVQLMGHMGKEIYTPGILARKAAEEAKKERRKASKKATLDAWRANYKDE